MDYNTHMNDILENHIEKRTDEFFTRISEVTNTFSEQMAEIQKANELFDNPLIIVLIFEHLNINYDLPDKDIMDDWLLENNISGVFRCLNVSIPRYAPNTSFDFDDKNAWIEDELCYVQFANLEGATAFKLKWLSGD